MSRARGLALAALVALATLLPAHVRLLNPANGSALYWTNPASISVVVQSDGSDDIHDGSHTTAMRNAIAAWNGVSGSVAHLAENTSPTQQARTDWQSDSIHLLMFDEANNSGYFPNGCGIVALTPVWFSGSGSITDADVLFNGRGFQFTTSGAYNRFDVQDVATHELGHLLGLDHSTWAGGTMYPYVDPSVLLHRSLSQDEVHGLRECYPDAASARIHGSLYHPNARPVKGAQVVALDSDGRPCAAAMSANNGSWRIYGLAPGTYTLYASPVDQPVDAGNFGGGHTIQIDFGLTDLGSASVTDEQDFNLGSTTVADENSLSFGSLADDFPLRAVRGTVTTLTIHGWGLVTGSTLACADPNVVVTPTTWFGSRVLFTINVPIDQPDGNLDLTLTDPQGVRRVLSAGIEVTPPSPAVSSLTPAQGTDAGGTLVTLHGSNFRAGQEVVLGGSIYLDGVDGGCEVLDSNTIQLTTVASPAGSCDAVVIDPSGVEGRRPDGYVFAHVPEIQSTFPEGGYAGGGTVVVLLGQNFEAGAVVRIDGVQQTQVELAGTTQIHLTTNAGVPGGPYQIEVENPGGAIATSLFSYAAIPDPEVVHVDPPAGPPNGGNTIRIEGQNLGAATAVLFGADAATGEGGTPAASLLVIDSNTLEVVAPKHASGPQNLLVRNDATGQAVLLTNAYRFQDASGGGGGGCYVQPYSPPAGPREMLAGAWWLCALLVFALRAQIRRPAALHLRACRPTSSPSTSR
ncbi:MAG: IPT/TIG domain-containing protein [Planctomycetes bacterium]|nr:IPT/TIG domain-containing protein [Planctomycetota bacterium]